MTSVLTTWTMLPITRTVTIATALTTVTTVMMVTMVTNLGEMTVTTEVVEVAVGGTETVEGVVMAGVEEVVVGVAAVAMATHILILGAGTRGTWIHGMTGKSITTRGGMTGMIGVMVGTNAGTINLITVVMMGTRTWMEDSGRILHGEVEVIEGQIKGHPALTTITVLLPN